MKYLFFAVLTFAFNSFSQTTAIPDVNFENALITLGYDSGSPDGSVLTANISSVTYLDVQLESISDLTGIEDFTLLEVLNCAANLLTSLDVSQNTLLTELYLNANDIASLNLTANTSLERLNVAGNDLSSLNINQNSLLQYDNVSDY